MAQCTSSCIGSVNDILTDILDQDFANGVRISQIVQAFEINNGVPQSDQGIPSIPEAPCSDSDFDLLSSILIQRQANFNNLQLVLEAV